MPRFFFHIRDGATLIEDPDGSELPDLAAAREEAAPAAGAAQEPAGGQWTGVRRAHARPVGLPERSRDRLLTTGQADRQRLQRSVQRPPTGGMPERLVVPVAGRCPRAH